MSFSYFGELWLAGSHGGGITSGMSICNVHPGASVQQQRAAAAVDIRNWGRRRCLRPYGGICVLQAC